MTRFIFYPLALLFLLVTKTRNMLYDWGFFESKKFALPLISIGNLSLGGTGKSPHTMYLIELVSKRYKTATLSRGYGRKTKGFLLANNNSNAAEIGDEPFQFYKRYGKWVAVAVGEKRVSAVIEIIKRVNPQVILLDDAFQHRQIKPSFSIVLTEYNALYSRDFAFPVGRLREAKSGYKRADIIVVTKCPNQMSQAEMKSIKAELNLEKEKKEVFFSTLRYANQLVSVHRTMGIDEIKNKTVVLVAGIANPSLFYEHILSFAKKVILMQFPDHHNFSVQDISKIKSTYEALSSDKIILTTEKDFMRLEKEQALQEVLFYLPINISFTEKDRFDSLILRHIKENA